MPQTINTNLSSLNAQRNLNTSQSSLTTSMQRLSSGLRVNSAKDDAAGLAIAERMNTQVRGMNVAIRNANDGISLAQTAEGALGKTADALQRMRELAIQSRNASNSDSDKDSLDKEFGQLADEVRRVLAGTTFNGKAILAVSAGSQTFQVGANVTANDSIDIVTTDMTSAASITSVAGTDVFSFIGSAGFAGSGAASAGQLRAILVTAGANCLVQADRDGNGIADFEILVLATPLLAAGDFLL